MGKSYNTTVPSLKAFGGVVLHWKNKKSTKLAHLVFFSLAGNLFALVRVDCVFVRMRRKGFELGSGGIPCMLVEK